MSSHVLHQLQGTDFSREAKNISSENNYHEKVFLNSQQIEKTFITYRQIVDGGNIHPEMTNK